MKWGIIVSKSHYEWSMLVIRLILGIIFLAHGLLKFSTMAGTVKFFISLGLPAVTAYVIATIESVGGAFLILGLQPRLAAAGISMVMLGAIFTVKIKKGLIGGYEFELSLLAMSVALILSGSSLFALQSIFPSSASNCQKSEV